MQPFLCPGKDGVGGAGEDVVSHQVGGCKAPRAEGTGGVAALGEGITVHAVDGRGALQPLRPVLGPGRGSAALLGEACNMAASAGEGRHGGHRKIHI